MNLRRRSFRKYWQLYLLLIPAVIFYVLFKYKPMLGLQIAFRDFKFSKGMWDSPWIGLEHFRRFFASSQSWQIIWNTFELSLLTLLFCFPMPILLALLINEFSSNWAKKTVQTITYAPHFVSTIVVIGMFTAMCSPSTGIINFLLIKLGVLSDGVYLMGSSRYFRLMYIITDVWKDCGWNAIIFISALSAIDPALYEAASIDGANKWKQLCHVTIPGIVPTIMIMLILQCGQVFNIGFEKVYAMQTDLNLSVSEVVSTYTYKMGIEKLAYDYSTAIGFFNSVISFAFLVTVNALSKRLSETSLW